MGKRYVFLLFSVVLMALVPARLCAQQDTEEDKIKSATAAFDREDYAAAMPLYSQLLSLHPTDPNYSYRFGVCMLFASADKGKALPFLEDASKDPKCEIDVWYYLGRAYHLNYRFDEAITAFAKYKKLAGEKKTEKLQVDNQIAMCKRNF
jgi:predicted Zn-dependent protease